MRRLGNIALGALTLVAVAQAAGCERRSARPGARRLRDGLGRAVALPNPVARVVSLAPSTTEIVYAVGAGDRLVGVDRYSDWPAAARALPTVGADVNPSLERILGLKPDVVLTATSANTQATAEALERLGVPVFVTRADSLADIYGDIASIGEVVGRELAALALIDSMQARMAAVRARVAARPRVRALVVVSSEPLMVAGRSSFIDDLLRAAGGDNVAGDSAQPFPTYSIERLLVRAPEVIVAGSEVSRAAALLERFEQLGGGAALGRQRVYTVDASLLFRPGPRVADAVEALARRLHP